MQAEELKKIPFQLEKDVKYLGAGDCQYFPNLLTDREKKSMFELVKQEVNWQTMRDKGGDVPRLISVQSELLIDPDTGIRSMPL